MSAILVHENHLLSMEPSWLPPGHATDIPTPRLRYAILPGPMDQWTAPHGHCDPGHAARFLACVTAAALSGIRTRFPAACLFAPQSYYFPTTPPNPSSRSGSGQGNKSGRPPGRPDQNSLVIVCEEVVLPRFELGQAEPKSAVLPLHHKTRVPREQNPFHQGEITKNSRRRCKGTAFWRNHQIFCPIFYFSPRKFARYGFF